MSEDIRNLFPDDISDEAVYHLVNFFYKLALTVESIHLGQLMRYEKSQIDLRHELINQGALKKFCRNIKPEEKPPF